MKKVLFFFLFIITLFIGGLVFIESHWLDNVSYINSVKVNARNNMHSYLVHEKNQLISDALDKLGYDPNYKTEKNK